MGMPVGGAEDLAVGISGSLASQGISTSFVCLRELGVVGEELAQKNAPVHLLKAAPGKRFSLPGLLQFARWLRANEIALVHSHTYHAHTYALPASRIAGIPAILHHHKTLEKMKLHRRWMMGWMLRKAAAVIALSEQTAHDLTDAFGLQTKKVHAFPNAVNTSVFFPASSEEKRRLREDLGISPDSFVIGSVASLNKIKNHQATVEAIALNGLTKKNTSVLILGEGRERQSLESAVNQYGLKNKVLLVGNQRPIAPWIRAMDVFVMPSFWEGQSLALLQAIAANLPILASNIEGNTAILRADHPGLFDPNDGKHYASLLEKSLNEPGFLSSLQEFQSKLLLPNWKDLTGKMEALYREIAGI